MAVHQLSAWTESIQEIAPQNASANVNSAAALDTQGWDGVLYEIEVGAMGNAGGVNFYVQASANSNLSGAANINYSNGTLVSINVANTNPNTHQTLDLQRPSPRYLQVCAVPTNFAFISVSSMRYRHSGVLPVTHAALNTVFVQVS